MEKIEGRKIQKQKKLLKYGGGGEIHGFNSIENTKGRGGRQRSAVNSKKKKGGIEGKQIEEKRGGKRGEGENLAHTDEPRAEKRTSKNTRLGCET